MTVSRLAARVPCRLRSSWIFEVQGCAATPDWRRWHHHANGDVARESAVTVGRSQPRRGEPAGPRVCAARSCSGRRLQRGESPGCHLRIHIWTGGPQFLDAPSSGSLSTSQRSMSRSGPVWSSAREQRRDSAWGRSERESPQHRSRPWAGRRWRPWWSVVTTIACGVGRASPGADPGAGDAVRGRGRDPRSLRLHPPHPLCCRGTRTGTAPP